MLRPRILIGLLLVLTACASDNDVPQPPDVQPSSPGSLSPKVPSNVPSYHDTSSAIPVPPKGALYTIYAARVEGDLHVQRANSLRTKLVATTKMPDWYVIHEETSSVLYYGYYKAILEEVDRGESRRAQFDRQKVDMITDEAGNRPFQRALFVELASPDPTANPKWNLVNAPGAYTLQIGVYRGTPERKQAAIDAVKAARDQGIEAYYYHGETASLVCVGNWPESAVKVPEDVKPAPHSDPRQPLMVAPQSTDAGVNNQFESVAQQGNMQLVRPQVQILDPTLQAMLDRFPHNTVNGMEIRHMVNGQEQYESALVRRIPHESPTASAAPGLNSGSGQPAYDPSYRPDLPRQRDPAPVVQQPAPQPQPGLGRLRSIGG